MKTMYGGGDTFAGVKSADALDPRSYAGADVLIVGAPFDGGTSHRPGARFGPHAIRTTDYLPLNGSRPHLGMGVDPLIDLRVLDGGDVLMPAGEIERSLYRLEQVVGDAVGKGVFPLVLGGDHSIGLPDVTGAARHHPHGRLGLVHFDAHSDAAENHFGSALGHGTWVRRLVEADVVPGERIVQIGQRNVGSPAGSKWRLDHGIRSYEMGELVKRGIDACLDEVFAVLAGACDAVFLSIALDVVDPAFAPAVSTPEPGGITSRELLDAAARCALELPLAATDVVELAPPYDGPAQATALLANRLALEVLSAVCLRRRRPGGSASA